METRRSSRVPLVRPALSRANGKAVASPWWRKHGIATLLDF
uniref:Uncharacterized protein n=1 Tax=Anguilla anguilla TaxID=7936 RepID=A0A0E9Q7H3_ANGAN